MLLSGLAFKRQFWNRNPVYYATLTSSSSPQPKGLPLEPPFKGLTYKPQKKPDAESKHLRGLLLKGINQAITHGVSVPEGLEPLPPNAKWIKLIKHLGIIASYKGLKPLLNSEKLEASLQSVQEVLIKVLETFPETEPQTDAVFRALDQQVEASASRNFKCPLSRWQFLAFRPENIDTSFNAQLSLQKEIFSLKKRFETDYYGRRFVAKENWIPLAKALLEDDFFFLRQLVLPPNLEPVFYNPKYILGWIRERAKQSLIMIMVQEQTAENLKILERATRETDAKKLAALFLDALEKGLQTHDPDFPKQMSFSDIVNGLTPEESSMWALWDYHVFRD